MSGLVGRAPEMGVSTCGALAGVRGSARAILLGVLIAVLGVLTAPGGMPAARAAGWWIPPQHLTWYWQLTGTVNNDVGVAAYDIDGFENSAAEVAALHAQSKHVICYIDVGTAENFRPDYSEFPPSVLGEPNGWPGEKWLDISQLPILEPIMTARFQMCKKKGFDAVEPDNIEGYANKSGFSLTAAEQLTYNEWVAEEVHSLGMAVLQKNDGEQTPELLPYFDGALSEQCNQYDECADFEPYLAEGAPVLNAEYSLSTSRFCAADDAAGIMGARFNLGLDGTRFEPCFTVAEEEPEPSITSLSAKKGPAAGGTSVTITGKGLAGATAVKFGSVDAASYDVRSSTTIIAVSPAETTGTVEVSVTGPNGTSAPTNKDRFRFESPTITSVAPSGGSPLGGTAVVVIGSGFAVGPGATVFKFGSTVASGVECTSSTECTMLSPAITTTRAKTVDVRAQVAGKTSKKNPPHDQYTYS